MRLFERSVMPGLLLALCSLIAPGAAASAQDVAAEPAESDLSYGYQRKGTDPDYQGEEIRTADGRIVMYRQSDTYDSYEIARGANATFIDMQTGKSRLVLPAGDQRLLFFLSIVYLDDEEEIGVGYVARVGTPADYARGKIDIIVGRFSDMEQGELLRGQRYLDSPTALDGERISMIVWPENDRAKYTVVDLKQMAITHSEAVDLPMPVEQDNLPCRCANGPSGEH